MVFGSETFFNKLMRLSYQPIGGENPHLHKLGIKLLS
jgi:hypothetical protein